MQNRELNGSLFYFNNIKLEEFLFAVRRSAWLLRLFFSGLLALAEDAAGVKPQQHGANPGQALGGGQGGRKHQRQTDQSASKQPFE